MIDPAGRLCTRVGFLAAANMTDDPFSELPVDGIVGLSLEGLWLGMMGWWWCKVMYNIRYVYTILYIYIHLYFCGHIDMLNMSCLISILSCDNVLQYIVCCIKFQVRNAKIGQDPHLFDLTAICRSELIIKDPKFPRNRHLKLAFIVHDIS